MYAMDGRNMRPFSPRIPLFKELFEAQDYIDAVLPHKGEHIDYDFLHWRNNGMPYGVTLSENQARWVRQEVDFLEPWLQVEPNEDYLGRIVVNRTPRYRNPYFPWQALVDTFRDEMVFIGLPEEYRDFCRDFGQVEYAATGSLLEAAQIISASEVFMGNQSSCNAIAEGLKHPMVQETCLEAPDCIFPRENAIHCPDGALSFEACGKSFHHERNLPKAFLDIHVTPPGGWKIEYEGCTAKCYAFDAALETIRFKLREAGKEIPRDLRERVIEDIREKHLPLPQVQAVTKVLELIATLNTQSESTRSGSDHAQTVLASDSH